MRQVVTFNFTELSEHSSTHIRDQTSHFLRLFAFKRDISCLTFNRLSEWIMIFSWVLYLGFYSVQGLHPCKRRIDVAQFVKWLSCGLELRDSISDRAHHVLVISKNVQTGLWAHIAAYSMNIGGVSWDVNNYIYRALRLRLDWNKSHAIPT